MRKLLISLFLLLPVLSFADQRWRADTSSVIEDSVCIPALDGEGYLHIDEDVSGLIVEVVGDDGTSIALYDAGTEFEDIAVLGTYATPSANNVRVSPDALGGDCTQMMFDDAVYAGQRWLEIRITDGQTTIMDYHRWVYLDLIESRDFGLLENTPVASMGTQVQVTLTDGASNDDAYPGGSAVSIFDATSAEKCETTVSADIPYAQSTKLLTLTTACPNFTVAAPDEVRIHAWGSARGQQVIDTELAVVDTNVDTALTDHISIDSQLVTIDGNVDDIEGVVATTGVVIATDAIDTAAIATAAIDADAIATDAIGALEIAASAIGASELAASAIGASELATDAIDASTIATAAIGDAEIAVGAIAADTYQLGAIGAAAIATDAIGALELAADAIGESEIATDAITAAEISTNAIGASEIASSAIGSDELATDAIGAGAIAANAIGASELATDAIGSDQWAASANTEVWAEVLETAGATYTGQCIVAALLAYVGGEVTTAGGVSTYQDPGGNLNRIVGTVTGATRDTITITCP